MEKMTGCEDNVAHVENSLASQVRSMLASEIPEQRELRRQQLLVMVDYVDRALRNIAAARLSEVTLEQIPMIRVELDTLQTTLAEAANELIATAETLEGIGARIGGADGDDVAAAATRIYELCGFQDLSGQRLTKIARIIDEFAAKLDALGAEVAATSPDASAAERQENEEDPEAHLLNGPQAFGTALSQADIDSLFDTLDGK